MQRIVGTINSTPNPGERKMSSVDGWNVSPARDLTESEARERLARTADELAVKLFQRGHTFLAQEQRSRAKALRSNNKG